MEKRDSKERHKCAVVLRRIRRLLKRKTSLVGVETAGEPVLEHRMMLKSERKAYGSRKKNACFKSRPDGRAMP